MPSSGAVRLGLVGAGGVALLHARAALALPGEAVVTAVHDIDPRRAAELSDLTGATVHPGYEEMFADEAVDALVVCTPHTLHTRPALAAARAGVHVLLEKPMATTLAECDAITQECARNDVVLALGHIQHYLPLTAGARTAVADGLIGRPVAAVDRRATDYRPGHRPAWFFDPALAGGGAVMNIGAHCIDRLTWATGRRPVRVAARFVHRGTPVETEGLLQLELDGGLTATVSVTSSSLSGIDEFEILGEDATLRASRDSGLLLAGPRGVEVLRPPSDIGADVAVAFQAQLRDFAAAVRGEAPPAVGARTGRDVVAAVLAASASAAADGTPHTVDLLPGPVRTAPGTSPLPVLDGA
ncbi:Gfo/Idh/MocA family oxidoreductase [Streptomyces sp. NA04227]|uniref:Gfo/Idh/MocA family protein n=1 Tax=Streptomyces sp. NA04227 TaxID=2742136 RepID=UPI00159154FF|nr:Gfo/Idh/MocA family oxidoreductase [Streptomyces sp. NA04227]QKW07618.1 Gfo/Idh/MocA family oxidoreductase [Streptomyces sp. NA04227]